MGHSNLIGINPDGPDLPLGLGMALAQNPGAMETFAAMTAADKTSLIRWIQSAVTGEDAESRVNEALRKLSGGRTP